MTGAVHKRNMSEKFHFTLTIFAFLCIGSLAIVCLIALGKRAILAFVDLGICIAELDGNSLFFLISMPDGLEMVG
jgi:hypothetical protein